MDPIPRKSSLLVHAMAGLQAGVVGVFWMFACFVVGAYLGGHSIWSIPNLFATVLYGNGAWQGEFVRTTWSGIALILVIYGLMGAFWGCWWGEVSRPFLRVFGALAGLGVYYIFFGYVWVHLAPWVPFYAPVRELQVAHIVWGAVLAGSPVYSRRISLATAPSAPTADVVTQEDAESVNGELIL